MPPKKQQRTMDDVFSQAEKAIKKIKEKKLEDLLNKKMVPVPGQPKTKPKKKKQKLTDKQKKNVDKDAIIMEKEDIPGTPHFKMVPKKSGQGSNILKAAKGGSVSKFPDLSGDGKVTQKDILMGRGVVNKKRGGSVTGKQLAGRLATRGYGKARK
jgi:hypothetical protein|tara:strand:+ start:3561 stop:4025 length:465 start_codon:yes stop_codon:yes gene_type:complete